MGREIRFRGWNNIFKKFAPDYAVYHFDGENSHLYFDVFDGSFGADVWDFSECSIMQCTGLKDKNGTEIYEGDIVEQEAGFDDAPLSKEIGNVIFDGCKFKTNSFELNLVSFGSFLIHYKVIGNIYENPELLEGGE